MAGQQPGTPEERRADSAAAGGRPGDPAARVARRRRLAEVFGDVLPETTGDDRPDDSPARSDERWYQENRPPHHERG